MLRNAVLLIWHVTPLRKQKVILGSLKGSLGSQKWFFHGIAVKTPFWELYFKECIGPNDSMDVKGSLRNDANKETLFLKV